MGDLIDRTDVEALLRRFYGQALADEILTEPFGRVREIGLDAHIPTMCDFWETVLFRAGRYRGNALTAHRAVHHRTPLSDRHFDRWLALWHGTVDEMYQGPAAERAKIQATRIAWAMHRRLSGGRGHHANVSVRSGSGPNLKWRPVISEGVTRT